MSGNLNRSKRAMKPYGNVTLMTLICIVVFWVFMALRPAQASGCGSSWAICAYRAQTHWYARNAMERRLGWYLVDVYPRRRRALANHLGRLSQCRFKNSLPPDHGRENAQG